MKLKVPPLSDEVDELVTKTNEGEGSIGNLVSDRLHIAKSDVTLMKEIVLS